MATEVSKYHTSQVRCGNTTYPVVCPLKKSGSALFLVYGHIVDDVLTRIGDTALQKIKSTPRSLAGHAFAIRTHLIHPIIQEWREPASEGKGGQNQLAKAALLTGLTPDEMVKCTRLAKSLATKFFSQDIICSYEETPETMTEWQKNQMVEAQNFLYGSIGMKRSERPVAFTDEDLTAFGIERAAVAVDPTTINCLSFALLKARVAEAADLIFKPLRDDQPMHQLFRNLKRWNFEPVSGDPRSGDLVVYLNSNDKPTHVGVYLGDDRVQSKIGIANPYSHVHRIFDKEDRAVFFRKAAQE